MRVVPPLAAALGFTCEGLTAARTERCTMLAMQCSAGHCAMLRAVWCRMAHVEHFLARLVALETVQCCARVDGRMAHVGHFLARLVALDTVQCCALWNAGHCAMLRAMHRRARCGALHYILVVGLWQRRNSSFRKTHTFGHVLNTSLYHIVDTVTCFC